MSGFRRCRRRNLGWRTTAITLAIGMAAAGCRIERLDDSATSTATDASGLEEQVTAILDRQAAAWNAGDLDGFMSAYSPSTTTTYIGSTGLIEGYEGIRERYAPLFEVGAARDSLRFEELRTREVDARVGVATARYLLERGGVITSAGPFTLVLLNVEGAWRIVHDQSAEDPGG